MLSLPLSMAEAAVQLFNSIEEWKRDTEQQLEDYEKQEWSDEAAEDGW